MATSLDIALSILRRAARFPDSIRAVFDPEDPALIRVHVHSDDLRHFNSNRAALEAVLDQKLDRRINLRFNSPSD